MQIAYGCQDTSFETARYLKFKTQVATGKSDPGWPLWAGQYQQKT